MGNLSHSYVSEHSLALWTIRPDSHTAIHSLTGQTAALHLIECSRAQLFKQTKIYSFRTLPQDNVAQVLAYQVENKLSNICSSKAVIQVLVQQTVARLDEFGGVSSRQGVIMLNQALIGFKRVFETLGQHFTVSAALVALTESNQVRVWFNPDFASNEPYRPDSRLQSPQDIEHDLVAQIFSVVEERVDKGFDQDFENDVISTLQRDNQLRFGRALWLVSNYIAR